MLFLVAWVGILIRLVLSGLPGEPNQCGFPPKAAGHHQPLMRCVKSSRQRVVFQQSRPHRRRFAPFVCRLGPLPNIARQRGLRALRFRTMQRVIALWSGM